MNKRIHLLSFALGGFFLFVDQIIKYYFFHHHTFSAYIIKPWLGLEYFENHGIAFGLPVPGWLVIVYTPFVILLLLLFIGKKQTSWQKNIALCLILAGAISNFIDRIFFEFTIDYIRVVTSILNIADVMIVVGALMLVREGMKEKKQNTNERI